MHSRPVFLHWSTCPTAPTTCSFPSIPYYESIWCTWSNIIIPVLEIPPSTRCPKRCTCNYTALENVGSVHTSKVYGHYCLCTAHIQGVCNVLGANGLCRKSRTSRVFTWNGTQITGLCYYDYSHNRLIKGKSSTSRAHTQPWIKNVNIQCHRAWQCQRQLWTKQLDGLQSWWRTGHILPMHCA